MANLEQLKKELLADGIIDSEEVKTIKAVIYEDGKIKVSCSEMGDYVCTLI